MTKIAIHQAPLQGYTDHIWRNAFHSTFGGIDCYYSSFLRIERGDFRRKDIRDILPENNRNINFVPQILACQPDEALSMANKIVELGYNRIDINLGCPFPPITRKNRGAGMLANPDSVEQMFSVLASIEGITYSVKMRLGMSSSEEWKQILPLCNIISPSHITVHPRIGAQQYKGAIDMEQFAHLYHICKYPVIYNGDITTTAQIEDIKAKFSNLKAVMIGRGLLYNPSMTASSIDYDAIHIFHSRLFEGNKNYLEGGDHQVLAKMLTYWEYLLPDVDKNLRKKILKSTSLLKYSAAVEDLFSKI
ncbi:MAG: tRNA-dihydrouridine synthase family protein [Muribaculaceae bacterium]